MFTRSLDLPSNTAIHLNTACFLHDTCVLFNQRKPVKKSPKYSILNNTLQLQPQSDFDLWNNLTREHLKSQQH